jgi:guanidinobutyrase
MRLPSADLYDNPAACQELDVAVLGIPLDTGTSFRTGCRFGPRQIRQESAMLRPFNMATGAAPFESLQIADCGDVPINTFHLEKSVNIITKWYTERVLAANCIPVTMGGDHTIALPLLRAMAAKYGHGRVGLVHVDAHADVNEHMFGEQIAHGTPFRRAVEENLLDCSRVVQIGLRGTGYAPDDFDWCRDQGFRVVQAEECWHKSLVPLMEEVRAQMGDGPVYLSYDIDSLDPAFAPGTGTLEVGGLTVWQGEPKGHPPFSPLDINADIKTPCAQLTKTPRSDSGLEIIRGLRGLDLVGADLVEVSPPYDMAGTTALTAANFLYEMLCVLPRVTYKE